MALSSDLVSQFTKVTNDTSNERTATTLRGVITKYDEKLYVQLDGSSELTPIARTVEVSEGDRVEVTIANHSATVTGNLSDPSIGVVRAGNLESRIEQNADSIVLLVKADDEFSKFQQTVEGFEFMGAGGTVKIQSGNINLTGAITWGDLAEDTQETIENAQASADSAQSKADLAYNIANGFYWPTYIEKTYINSTTIKSPTIEGNDVIARTAFHVTPVGTDENGNDAEWPCGAMGVAFGEAFDENLEPVNTYGVAMASSETTVNDYGYITFDSKGYYVIVTNRGVRLQAGKNNITVTDNGAFYNGVEIGGNGSITPVWG